MTKPKSRRIAPGLYETPEGHTIEFVEGTRQYPASWMLTPRGEHHPTDAFPTKRDALEAAAELPA